jgi:rfaE bifunctional protein kinase chain/domain
MINQDRFEKIINEFKNIKPILVIGDVGVDKYSHGVVNRISPEAPVPVLEVSKEWMKLGLAANVSDNLQSLGVKSTLCGVIGDDKNADTLEELLEDSNLKTWGLVRDSKRMTTFKERVVTEVQQICRIDYETKDPICNDTYTRLKGRFNEFKEAHSSIIIEDYGKGLFSKTVLEFLICEASEMGITISVDPARSTPPQWYTGSTLLKPNQVESELMVKSLGYTKKTSVEERAKILIDKLNLEKIIITLGAHGMAMMDTKLDGKLHEIPTVAKEVFDVSGAGDTAISAISAAISAGATLEEAAWIGNCASGVVVGKTGTALVTTQELSSYFNELVNSTINS